MDMLVLSFFSWWYGRGWSSLAKNFLPRLSGVAAAFSVSQLVRTLFAPWRRIITYPGRSLGERFRAWTDNLFSRLVGFVVRLLVLFAALVTIVVVAVLSCIELIAWPLLPISVPILLLAGLIT